jgi:hypothetical protein
MTIKTILAIGLRIMSVFEFSRAFLKDIGSDIACVMYSSPVFRKLLVDVLVLKRCWERGVFALCVVGKWQYGLRDTSNCNRRPLSIPSPMITKSRTQPSGGGGCSETQRHLISRSNDDVSIVKFLSNSLGNFTVASVVADEIAPDLVDPESLF